MKYLWLPLLLALILLLPRYKGTQPDPLLDADAKILAFGDSLTFGYGAKPQESSPATLAQLTHHPITNAGVSGEVSQDGLRRLRKLLNHTDAKLLLLCHGGNDILRKYSKKALQENIHTMVQLAKQKGMQVLLIGVPDLSFLGLETLPLYTEIAQEESIVYMPHLLENILSTAALKSDMIHPNAKGYKKMAEAIYAKLKEENILE